MLFRSLDVRAAWRTPGARGDGVDFFDLEFGFDPRHVELAGTVGDFEGLDPSEAFPNVRPGSINHGTASTASAVGADDGNGVTGIAPAAGKHFLPVRGDAELSLGFLIDSFCQAIEHPPGNCINQPTALVYPLVSQQLSRGDVLLIVAGRGSSGGR